MGSSNQYIRCICRIALSVPVIMIGILINKSPICVFVASLVLCTLSSRGQTQNVLFSVLISIVHFHGVSSDVLYAIDVCNSLRIDILPCTHDVCTSVVPQTVHFTSECVCMNTYMCTQTILRQTQNNRLPLIVLKLFIHKLKRIEQNSLPQVKQ